MHMHSFVKIYYSIRPLIPRWLQVWLRRRRVSRQLKSHAEIWPIDSRAAKKPDGWQGWPDGKKFALVLTHDVELARGLEKIPAVMEIEKSAGFRSSFNLVPERYNITQPVLDHIVSEGFEIGVHGLKHDGKLYNSRAIFTKRAKEIRKYLEQWGSVGFRSPAMHHHLEWILELDVEYDSSTFDTDPFEPQPDALCSIFPVRISNKCGGDKQDLVELPCTLPQDLTLFVLMREDSIDIWKRKLDWIAEKGGLALINSHPDYMYFQNSGRRSDEYPADYYRSFIAYVASTYKEAYWHALPREVARFWAQTAIRDLNSR